ncbi:hypothetical protein EC2021H102_47080 [Escherichia coli]
MWCGTGFGCRIMIIISQIMRDLGSNRVIPIVIDNEQSNVLTFVATCLWLDFYQKLRTTL